MFIWWIICQASQEKEEGEGDDSDADDNNDGDEGDNDDDGEEGAETLILQKINAKSLFFLNKIMYILWKVWNTVLTFSSTLYIMHLSKSKKVTMKYVTKHAKQRMNQRGIKQSMIDLTLEHGEFDHKNRCVLNKKTAIQVMEDLKVTLKTVMKVIDKGGLVVVEESGRVVTTYNYNK